MSALFKQNDFSGGLNTQVDATKSPDNSFPLLINGRVRRNVVSPTKKHVKLSAPAGNYQGLYATGTFLLLFVDGLAYRADITDPNLIFYPIAPWVPMSAAASRIYAELCPASSNLFQREGSPDEVSRTFSGTVAAFNQAIYVFDGVTQPQVVFADGTSIPLGSYSSWTKDNPNYVPVASLPCFASNKLFLASPDKKSIYHSVSGRPSDFMVNIDAAGDKGGDAGTVSAAVSFNEITAIKSLSTGQIFIGTLYGSFAIELDYADPIFGEPYLRPVFLFPSGPVNELSTVDILQDTAFITQSGIHAFNAVAQSKRESNNYPLGAKIRGLLTDPDTGQSIIQADTCATLYDDYAFFAVNTVHGYGAIVYDTISGVFQSLDLSFGRVKQFAVTRSSGVERMFFITHDNQVYEAFAAAEKNSTRVYLGEFVPDAANQDILASMVDIIFSTVRTSGQAKVSIYTDRKLVKSGVVECSAEGFSGNIPMPIPFPDAVQSVSVDFQTEKVRGNKLGVLIEWNFDGDLISMSIDGAIQTADNVDLTVPVEGAKQILAFVGNSGATTELNPGGNFPAEEFLMIAVTQGSRYIYVPNDNGVLINGDQRVTQGVFTAADNTVKIAGSGAATFSLRLADDYLNVLDAIQLDKDVDSILHGGKFAYTAGSETDVALNRLPLRKEIAAAPGSIDIATDAGKYFFAKFGKRYGGVRYDFLDVFFFNGEPSEPDGRDSLSLQAGIMRNFFAAGTAPFKLVVVNRSPLTEGALSWLDNDEGIDAVLSADGSFYQRAVVNNTAYLTVGTGGQPLGSGTPYADPDEYLEAFGYLRITSDALTCLLEFVDVTGSVRDSYALYT